MPRPPAASVRALFAWCWFDWANSAFPTVIATFIFAAYFARAVAPDEVAGTVLWGYAIGASGLAIAIMGPILGAIADRAGRRKPWLVLFVVVCVGATALLWFVRPNLGDVLLALVLVAIANFAFETGTIFYNAMLTDLATPRTIGRLSGWAWGLGYLGGLACLAVALVALVRPDPPLFGLDAGAAENVRATALLVALWFGLFALPTFLFVPDRPSGGISIRTAVAGGLAQLAGTIRSLRPNQPVARFLLAHMVYADGLNTLFAFGGIYAAGTFGLAVDEIIVFGIAINVTAGIGATLFAWADDRIGSKRTILAAIVGTLLFATPLLFVEGKAAFWAFALPLGLFMGPAQSASRSLMAHLAPPGRANEMFGLYALSGKATAFVGPAVVAAITDLFASQRAGMATVVVLLAAGGALLLSVPDRRAERG